MRITKTTTKTGDTGNTLLGCNIVSKGHPAIELLGELDTLNVMVGDIGDHGDVQDNIFSISAAIYKGEDWSKSVEETGKLDGVIFMISTKLPNLVEFIRPSGRIHAARTQTRKCERLAWSFDPTKKYNVYLNRLSDYLFVLARERSENEVMWDRS